MDKSDRFTFLDALRGMAALTVFFSHAIGMLPTYYVGSFLGKISYSLYLMHFPVLLLVFSCKFHWQICIFLSLFFQFYLPLEYIS